MSHRLERVVLETPRHRIEGTLTLAREGYRSRVSDLLNSDREFLSLTDVTVSVLDAPETPVEHHDFLAVSRSHVVLAGLLSTAPALS